MTDEKKIDTDMKVAQTSRKESIKGVFSIQRIQRVGTGTTTRKTIKKAFWFADEQEDGTIKVQPLNANYVPSGARRDVPREDFLEKFSPEPEFYVSTVFPKMKELQASIDKGEKHRERGESFSAELEFGHALGIDEENVRANFGLGLTYLERGEDAKANDIFERLVKLDAAFEKKHKHLFNEFGINLRKNKMFEQSMEYYSRALELSQQDEHLFYNMARVSFEQEDWGRAATYLTRALELNRDFPEALRFMDYLQDNKLVDRDGKAIPGALRPVRGKKHSAPKKRPGTNYVMDV
ncbi:tetratricopeptide repeat protein [Desulfobaculum bizertense]|uniref:Tetratricopeptide repeat-containing protein n=1 Tax=Desulfobaculum bizertense DSM 18034 TaxID=1121442 RepID=A0A1T4WH54_9BACT|nr:tetratricopeptide repeat protein [Desulfobaculum bizertense]UIJ36637.1 tetratricopeptide repeat protein [Desulfobaculum bizertense]SKA76245.1 Tetratricopeptide repeat-containing protein [Desulfobaculum bizertense DSM 18034]